MLFQIVTILVEHKPATHEYYYSTGFLMPQEIGGSHTHCEKTQDNNQFQRNANTYSVLSWVGI